MLCLLRAWCNAWHTAQRFGLATRTCLFCSGAIDRLEHFCECEALRALWEEWLPGLDAEANIMHFLCLRQTGRVGDIVAHIFLLFVTWKVHCWLRSNNLRGCSHRRMCDYGRAVMKLEGARAPALLEALAPLRRRRARRLALASE